MLPNDPERQVVGRTIAAMLMASEIKQVGEIQAEAILTAIGALAGFAAQISIRKGMIAPQGLDPDTVLVEVMTKSGEKFYFSDILNWILFENMSKPPYSIWAYVSSVVPEKDRLLLPHMGEIVGHAARTAGTRRFGIPRLPPEHRPRIMPRAALETHWRQVQQELVGSRRDPSEWPFDLAGAAQWQMLNTRLPLAFAAAVVMEAAIPMSKVDPTTVPGA